MRSTRISLPPSLEHFLVIGKQERRIVRRCRGSVVTRAVKGPIAPLFQLSIGHRRKLHVVTPLCYEARPGIIALRFCYAVRRAITPRNRVPERILPAGLPRPH